MHELALFAGAGGGILGGHLLGWRTVCAVEWDAYAASVLVARQNDGCLPPFAIWDDVQTFDGRLWRGRVDVISGGFPCQDISAAGKGAGIEGERSGMWKHMARIVGEVLPQFVLVENSPMLVGRGLAVVLADLAEMGYDAEWGVVGAHHAGAPHRRDRIWIVGHANSIDRRAGNGRKDGKKARHAGGNVADTASGESRFTSQRERREDFSRGSQEVAYVADADSLRELQPQGSEQEQRGRAGNSRATVSDTGSKRGQLSAEWELAAIEQPWSDGEARSSGGIAREWWATEPNLGGMVDGMAVALDIHGADAAGNVDRVARGTQHRVDRLRCIGNGQVPAVAKLAFNLLKP
jgi:DNA (cytosine-5)-methyltransferase 1